MKLIREEVDFLSQLNDSAAYTPESFLKGKNQAHFCLEYKFILFYKKGEIVHLIYN